MKPVLLVTGHAPPERRLAFAALDEREGVELALFGGRDRHGAQSATTTTTSQRGVYGLAASGRFRAVVCGTGGRVALPGAYAGARRARVPFVLWASLWAHPRSLAHAASYLPTRHLYAHADAVVTYGLHVSAYVKRRGARRVHVAPQAVDPVFWSAPADAPERRADFQAGVLGRDDPGKGLDLAPAPARRARPPTRRSGARTSRRCSSGATTRRRASTSPAPRRARPASSSRWSAVGRRPTCVRCSPARTSSSSPRGARARSASRGGSSPTRRCIRACRSSRRPRWAPRRAGWCATSATGSSCRASTWARWPVRSRGCATTTGSGRRWARTPGATLRRSRPRRGPRACRPRLRTSGLARAERSLAILARWEYLRAVGY